MVDKDNVEGSTRDQLRHTADELAAIAASLEQQGDPEVARLVYRAAAEIDLGDSELQQSWGGPFNGQEQRCRLFLDLVERVKPAAIVETGTYRATTTQFIAEHFQGPIFSCEIVPRQFLQSQAKMRAYSNVSIAEADSRSFLRDFLSKKTDDQPVFFYLDAHWQEDLPLREEIELILGHGKPSVIMVDDFQVPFDPGYRYDDYGPGKVLSLEIIAFLRDLPVGIAFPKLSAEEETGAKRGCVVLSTADLTAVILESPLLRGGDWRDWAVIDSQTQLQQRQTELQQCRAELQNYQAELQTCQQQLRACQASLAEIEQKYQVERRQAVNDRVRLTSEIHGLRSRLTAQGG